jgi:hypothetical protein
VKRLTLLLRLGLLRIIQKKREETERKNLEKIEPIRSSLRLSPVTRRTSRLIGHGRNLKKRKIAKNWLR